MSLFTKEKEGRGLGFQRGIRLFTSRRERANMVNKLLLGHPDITGHKREFGKQNFLASSLFVTYDSFLLRFPS